MTWGAAGTAGWHVKYFVDGDCNQLVRRVTDGAGLPRQVDQVLARNVDASYGGVGGFTVVTDNCGTYQVSLRVLVRSDQTVWRRSESTTVHVRN